MGMKQSTIEKKQYKSDFGRERIEILYQDEWLAVILKPTGMLSVPYPGSTARTAQAVLENLLRNQGRWNQKHRPLAVHRLDRDTSGVMMFALTESACKKIMDSWHTMVTERLYRAVAENPKSKQTLPESGIIDAPIAQNAHNVGFVPQKGDFPDSDKKTDHTKKHDGKSMFKTVEAKTHYKIVERGSIYTLFELELDTGKKNQIRAHLSSLGYPLAGDENYRAKTNPLNRLALHARTLTFVHPWTGKTMRFEVPEPDEWLTLVKQATELKNPVEKKAPKKMREENLSSHPSIPKRKKMLAKMDFIARGKSRQ